MPTELSTATAVRRASRKGSLKSFTSGLAPSYIQVNLIILPARYAPDFRLLCARNPVPCPLIAESASAGNWSTLKSCIPGLTGEMIATDIDIRRDAPQYVVYRNGRLIRQCDDVIEQWTEDHVAFLIGCSFSFESALEKSGLIPRHIQMGTCVPMYRTKISLCPAGAFTQGTYVVSMRPYKRRDIERIRDITRDYPATHGEPVAWGWDAIRTLGIQDINRPEWGDPPLRIDGRPLCGSEGNEDEIPVFWGCGVTPQEAVMQADLAGIVLGHLPGHMLVLDCRDWDLATSHCPRK